MGFRGSRVRIPPSRLVKLLQHKHMLRAARYLRRAAYVFGITQESREHILAIVPVKLPKGIWTLDTGRPLGRPGGFGAVFAGVSAANEPVAIKRLHITADDAAHRELKIASEFAGRSFTNVLPVIDSGQDADSGTYYLIM